MIPVENLFEAHLTVTDLDNAIEFSTNPDYS